MLVLFLSAHAQNSTVIKIGENISKIYLSESELAYYTLHIGDEYYLNDDLIIKVIPLNYESDPDIYISKSEQYPNASSDSDWQCAAYGKDTCTINHKNITLDSDFYIGIACP